MRLRKIRTLWLNGLLALCLGWSSLPAQADSTEFNVTEVVKGLGIPWGMAFLDDNRLIFTQRAGKAGILDVRNGDITWLKGVPFVYNTGQGGLLDVKPSPDFKQTGWIYFTYSKPLPTTAITALARAKIQGDELVNWEDLMVTKSESYRNIHFGSRIAFDHRGHVFFSVGDRGRRHKAQQQDNHAGSILRLMLDGDIPKDNPFVGQPGTLPEIWSYGHRNPQGLAYDVQHQRLWEIEHGPRGGDEINLIQKGQNYGWPIVSRGKEYGSGEPVGKPHQAGMIEPVKVYIPSIAPSSLLLYDGDAFPQWRGNLFAGSLVLRHLNQVVLSPEGKAIAEHRLLKDLNQRIRSLAQDAQGHLYVATDSGKIYRLSPK
jgi:glucose/arabinose dehydrogenase